MPIATRLTNSGTLLVNGSFDENTSIAPSKFRTTSTTVYAGTLDEVSLAAGAISFNGTNQYLTATSPDLSGTWTVEMWCYWTSGATQTTIVSFNNGSNSGINLWKNSSNQLVADDGVNGVAAMTTVTPTIGAWNHIAFVRSGTTTSGYVNGVLAGTTTYTPGTTSAISVGRYNGGTFFYFPGYISNLRVVNGTAVYTAAFTPPQAILPNISGTSFLLNVVNSTDFIKDNSSNVYTVTNNGTATWTAIGPFNQGSTTLKQRQVNDGTQEVYTQFDEFTGAPVVDSSLRLWLDAGQTTSYPGSGATWTDLSGQSNTGTLTNSPTFSSTINGGVFTFNGSSQYATTTLSSATISDGTLSAWFYPIASPNAGYFDGIIDRDLPGSYGTGIGINNGTYQAILNNEFWTTIGQNVTLNQWVMVSMTFTATTAIFYLNGAQVATLSYTRGAVSPGTSYLVGKSAANARYFNGHIATAMIYNRALTADEITTNFNALRGRYGI